MSYTEVTSESWFSRLGNAIKGVLFGVVLFLVSFPLLWWNEGRAVRTAQGLQEARRLVVTVPADQVDVARDKQLVHTTGKATTEDVLRDATFDVATPAIKLRRRVEMYQWKESERSEKRNKIGGGQETVKTYTYDKVWSENLISSDRFKQASQHPNPKAMRFSTSEQMAKDVRLGAFTLSSNLTQQMRHFDPLPFAEADREKLPEELRKNSKAVDNVLWLPNDAATKVPEPTNPQVGDLRIVFEAVRPAVVSIMALQSGSTFTAWQSKSNTTVERLSMGELSAEQMVSNMERENTILTWLIRAGGCLLMAFGIGLVLNPLSVVADVVPIMGDLLRMGVGICSLIAALSLSLVTISLAWLAYRPLLAGSLIVAAVLLFVFFKRLGARRKLAPAA